MKTSKKKCICDEMSRSTEFFTAKTFDCPVHGRITIDKRVITTSHTMAPAVTPNIPSWPPFQPYVGDPPDWMKYGPTCRFGYTS